MTDHLPRNANLRKSSAGTTMRQGFQLMICNINAPSEECGIFLTAIRSLIMPNSSCGFAVNYRARKARNAKSFPTHLASYDQADLSGVERQKADAFLVSYPKSGRTWFRFVLSSYFAHAFNLDMDVDLHSMFKIMPNLDGDPVRGLPAFAFGKFRHELPLIPVSHLDFQGPALSEPARRMMVRDPRDVIVSSYFHATRQKHSFQGDIGQFITDRQLGLPALVRYLNGWSKGMENRRTHVLSYENLTSDTAAETAKVLSFLRCKIKVPELEKAVEAVRFKRNEKNRSWRSDCRRMSTTEVTERACVCGAARLADLLTTSMLDKSG